MVPMATEDITTEALRLHLVDLAVQVQSTVGSRGIQAVRGQPRYQLAAVALVDRERLRTCVRIKPDEFRRHFSEIRALVRVEDVPFGIIVRGQVAAVFQRHPTYRPTAAEEYRAEFVARQGEAPDDLGVRLRAIEEKLTAVGAQLADQAARVNALESRASR
jgi:hypothetical protein